MKMAKSKNLNLTPNPKSKKGSVDMKKNKKPFLLRNLANGITGGRILAFWFCVWQTTIYRGVDEKTHLIWYVAVGLIYGLDFLDGLVARATKTTSPFGADFDPLGDKLVAMTMLLVLIELKIFPIWLFAIILFREIVVTSIRYLAKVDSVEFKTSGMGKMRTNIIGFGGGIMYAMHYAWINRTEVTFVLGGITCLLLLNLLFAKKRFLMKAYGSITAKLVVLLTFGITLIHPLISIPFAMFFITIYTLYDYSDKFYSAANDEKIWWKSFFGYLVSDRATKLFIKKARCLRKLARKRRRGRNRTAKNEKVIALKERKSESLYSKRMQKLQYRREFGGLFKRIFRKGSFKSFLLRRKNKAQEKKKRWRRIKFQAIIHTIMALSISVAMFFGIYWTTLGQNTTLAAIFIVSTVFISQLIAKTLLPTTTTKQMLPEANNSNSET
jgi:phosphatidylglycerophosphate synthase